MPALTVVFENLDDFAAQMLLLERERIEPLNKEFAYAIKQQSDARDLVPRLTGNLQETATPLDWQSTEWDGRFAYITYPAVYAARVWFGVNFTFTITENINAQAKWLEPILNDHSWVKGTIAILFHKHITEQAQRNYGRFIM